jgi:hypothetical protein
MTRPEYQNPPESLVGPIWARGYIEAWELFRIAAWKSANGNLAWLSLEEPDHIASQTGKAIAYVAKYRESSVVTLRDKPREWEAFLEATSWAVGDTSGLRFLRGIRLPTATAVLALLNPKAWPVIDRWGAKGVFGAGSKAQLNKFATYRCYTEHLVDIQREKYPDKTIHQVDQEVMSLSMLR